MVLISGPLKTVGPGFTKMASGMINLFLQSQRVEANKDGKVIYIYIYIKLLYYLSITTPHTLHSPAKHFSTLIIYFLFRLILFFVPSISH